MESILKSIKKQLGIHEEYDHFDSDIIMHINTVFMLLNQLGVGPENGFWIEDDVATWSDYLVDPTQLQMVKTYMGHKVRMIFDPPSNGTIANAMNQIIAEFEWRLNIAADKWYVPEDRPNAIAIKQVRKDITIIRDELSQFTEATDEQINGLFSDK